MTQKVNLVFMGGFEYPRGMAATRRIQNIIIALKEYSDVNARVILQRQSSENNTLSGKHEGTPYETVMGDLFRAKLFIMLPLLYCKTMTALKRAYQPDCSNVIYFYGPLFIDSIVPLIFAKRLGYKIVFDVIEDFGLAKEVSRSLYQYARSSFVNKLSLQIRRLAAGIIVISSYLEEKAKQLTNENIPLHYMAVSVDMNRFPAKSDAEKPMKTLLYAGSFGKKDGVLVLLDAFDKLAVKHTDIRLLLTGRGDEQAMKELFARVEVSPYKGRIDYRGYLNDEDYYALVNEADIPCMTRVDLAFAQAGFPFKLGEFLATGNPVIATKVSDVERFIVNKHNAMLIQANSSDAIYQAAEPLLADPKAAKAIGMKGREVACSNFDNKQQTRDLLTFIRAL